MALVPVAVGRERSEFELRRTFDEPVDRNHPGPVHGFGTDVWRVALDPPAQEFIRVDLVGGVVVRDRVSTDFPAEVERAIVLEVVLPVVEGPVVLGLGVCHLAHLWLTVLREVCVVGTKVRPSLLPVARIPAGATRGVVESGVPRRGRA